MFPRFLRWIFDLLSRLLTRRVVSGLENLPTSGPYILAINHLSYFDLPFVFGVVGGEDVTGWAAEKYAHHPLFGPILRMGGGIFIDRGEVDRSALSAAEAWLGQGKIFGMAPEGTRSKDQQLQRGKTGVAYLSHTSGAPIVPVGIHGTEDTIHCWLRLRRPTFYMRIGEPFTLPALDPENRTASLRRDTDEIMCRIAALLPPEYRGLYADHPRLQELLRQ
ncbi:MAG: lysophospholipid acyltransferase family protein [Anaerolineales bacterium]|jgi:1-acyl-sn-glycerol-3-phosphate acyltransferase